MRSILGAAVLWFGLTTGASHAHELSPAIADLVVDRDRATLSITTNLEAIVARIGPEHDSTVGTPAEALYNDLRALPADALAARYRIDGPEVAGLISLSAEGGPLTLTPSAPRVPEIGDTALPRETELIFALDIGDAQTAVFAWDASLGPIVLRVTRADGTDGFAGYLADGNASPPIDLIGEPPSVWQRLFGR
ncbi:MAG: hypothetical protein AAFQ36_01085 [Pseudomonadota bacterium]